MENSERDAGIPTTSSPTPYADVNAVLHDFAVHIQALLGRHFHGMYVYGSLALGDFDPRASDIDFLVVTDAELADDLIQALRELHERFDAGHSPWAGKVEAAYIPREALHHSTPTAACYPQVEKERPLFMEPLEIGWSFQRHTLREYGIKIAGPDPRQLFAPVAPGDLRRAAAVIAGTWLGQVHDADWLAWARPRGNQAFVVLTLCRLLYALHTATVASKPAAAHWAQKTLEPRWSAFIERSLAGQHESRETPERDMDDMIAFIQYTVEQLK